MEKALIIGLFKQLRCFTSRHWSTGLKVIVYLTLLLFVFSRVFFPGDKRQVFFGWDVLNAYWPDFSYRFLSIWRGEFPLWNPYELGGMPFAMRSQVMLFYPPSWLLSLFAFPDGRISILGMQYFGLFHFLVGALGAHALARHLGSRESVAYFAGITAVLCAPILTHRNSNFLYPLVWLPWLLLVIDRLFESPNRRTALFVATVGILAGSAASPPGVFNVVWTAALFSLASLPLLIGGIWKKQGHQAVLLHFRRLVLWGGIAVTLTLLYLAITYLPAIELLEHSSRANRSMGYILDRALRFKHLPSLFNAHHPQTWWFDLFVGISTLVALGPALLFKPDRRVWILAVIALLSVWVAIGEKGGLLLSAVEHLPGFSLNRKAYRYAAVFGILAGPLAARGISVVLDVSKSSGKAGPFASPIRNRIYAALTLLVAVLLVFYFTPSVPQRGSENTIWGARIVPWEAAGVCVLLGLCLMIPQLGKKLVVVPLLTIFVIHGAHLYWSAGDRLALNQSLKHSQEKKYLRSLPTTSIKWRLGLRGPRLGMGSRELVRYASGYRFPMQLRRHTSFMKWAKKKPRRLRLFNVRFLRTKKKPGKGAKPLGTNLWEVTNPVPLIAHYSAVKRVSDGRALKHLAKADRKGLALVEKKDWNVELDSLVAKRGVRTTGNITGYSANRITATIETEARGLLVFNEVYFPGWSAFVDDKESRLYRCNHLLRGVVVGPGKHRVYLRYWPDRYSLLLALLALAIVGLGVLAFGWRRDSEKNML